VAEVSKDAALFIAVSWQARGRALQRETPDKVGLQLCNSIVLTAFAAYYVEASLTKVIAYLGKTREMMQFLNPRNSRSYHPGLEHKLAWFYNEFIARDKARDKRHLLEGAASKRTHRRLARRFPGYAVLRGFRNATAHGKVSRVATSLKDVLDLRDKAKAIVEDLREVTEKKKCKVAPRRYGYKDAVAHYLGIPVEEMTEVRLGKAYPSS